MAPLDRLLVLVSALSETVEGLTLDEMAEVIGKDRRTAERLRDVIRRHFDLDESIDDRRKRFRIQDSLRRHFTRPDAAEIAALEAVVEGGRRSGTVQAHQLEKLLSKIKGALDDREKRRLAPDLEPLVALQRRYEPAGPALATDPEALAQVQFAIMSGQCLEFSYLADSAGEPAWRRVIPYGLVLGPVTYLIGKIPGRRDDPVPYRLDRMSEVRLGNEPGAPPEDWDLDAWMAQSFGIWREDGHAIRLRVRAGSRDRALNWRFHPHQQLEDDGEELIVQFHSGGLREIAEHLFVWGGEILIEAPDELREVMAERLGAAALSLTTDIDAEGKQ